MNPMVCIWLTDPMPVTEGKQRHLDIERDFILSFKCCVNTGADFLWVVSIFCCSKKCHGVYPGENEFNATVVMFAI